MSKLGIMAAFTIGAALGSVISWKILKTKYEQIADEEIESVKEAFANRQKEENHKENENLKEEIEEYKSKINNNDYDTVKEEKDMSKPYVISPNDYGELDGYELVSLTYYADGVLTDELNNVIDEEEVDELVGKESLNTFGEYEDDSVFVRNDDLLTDYEILYDQRNYSESVNE